MLFCSIKGANRGYIQVLLATSRNRIYFRRRSNESKAADATNKADLPKDQEAASKPNNKL
ncbi:hypothetical protein [Cardinium endosymbiont of Tipula unca]|uniref:hypothetical protein n=1 Tax=Cardinium endosymbiont of Tipula unca TaxID=3066216 RepID=UPI0030D05848